MATPRTFNDFWGEPLARNRRAGEKLLERHLEKPFENREAIHAAYELELRHLESEELVQLAKTLLDTSAEMLKTAQLAAKCGVLTPDENKLLSESAGLLADIKATTTDRATAESIRDLTSRTRVLTMHLLSAMGVEGKRLQ